MVQFRLKTQWSYKDENNTDCRPSNHILAADTTNTTMAIRYVTGGHRMKTEKQTPARVHTYEEIAQELGITRSAARKIEQRALRKLKKSLADKGLTLSDYI